MKNLLDTLDMGGDKLFEKRAREALPILVRQAASRSPIYYADLAAEIDMPNARNLNYVLGSVGASINTLSELGAFETKIPQIQSIVINKNTRLPGEGFIGYLAEKYPGYKKLSLAEKRNYLDSYWSNIYEYREWGKVLEYCGLSISNSKNKKILDSLKRERGNGGGEGIEHLKLKKFVSANPKSVGLKKSSPDGQPEHLLPSGDKIDVLFDNKSGILGVEVKSKISNNADIARGLFQCVKYLAVLEAVRGFNSERYQIETILVVGRKFPDELISLRSSLGVRVVEITTLT